MADPENQPRIKHIAIAGNIGAGKTTFMDIVTGKTRPDSGVVRWGAQSENLLRYNESQIACKGIGRKFQRPTVFEAQSVYDNLLIALKKSRKPLSVLFDKKHPIDEERISELAQNIGLKDHLYRMSGALSHGQKQWLEIGMLLAQNPQLLLIDEPAAGMTSAERDSTVALLHKVAQSRSVVVVEHDMEFVRNLNCRVTVLHEGAVLAEGSLDYVSANPEVIKVYLGR